MNLATARSLSRAKEIGVRKVIGAGRQSLAGQFLSESLLVSFISLLAALVLAHFLLPYFNLLTDKKIVIDFSSPFVVSGFVGITLLTGLMAGSYPAFFLSSLRAIQVLKDKWIFRYQRRNLFEYYRSFVCLHENHRRTVHLLSKERRKCHKPILQLTH